MASASSSSSAGDGTAAATPAPQAKRTRVLLSCAPCRNSKLKCDRGAPCGQCIKKDRAGACVYAPRPEKKRRPPARSMAARLRRLEGLVRGMIDSASEPTPPGPGSGPVSSADAGGYVVQGGGSSSSRATSTTDYVGGTHFMAVLEDIEDLKNYFEDPAEGGDETHDPYENTGPQELMMFSKGVPRNKDELLALLPERSVCDRIMNRYFNSNSPSRHIIHIPTFTKEYNNFWKNPNAASLHWIALLYMVLALGVFFSSFAAPHELENDSDMPVMDRVKQCRGASGWALSTSYFSYQQTYFLLFKNSNCCLSLFGSLVRMRYTS
ncbi:hypothetical protein F4779DRAFT_326508 [Xylariaceae sp. FL0662B]|nr:hypothetical protein F4779DRAFT_326508 [Xylariaceae sp. FL0662B]